MGSKQIMIRDSVYEDLNNFKDDNGLTSFTNAIQVLLNFRLEKEAEVTAFIKAHVQPQLDAMTERTMKKLDEYAEQLCQKAT